MAMPHDWRLANQETFLKGATLHWAQWSRPRQDWDHDHCVFCWAKFMEDETPNTLQAGYTTDDGCYWVCCTCYEDFKEKFKWCVR
jgi:hypothetical protein